MQWLGERGLRPGQRRRPGGIAGGKGQGAWRGSRCWRCG